MTRAFEPLNALDACDRCGAAARVRLVRAELVLDFCGHDYGKVEFALATGGWIVAQDIRFT